MQTTPRQCDRNKIAGALRTALPPGTESIPNLSVILALHSSYVDRYHKDLDRTWTSATWLVALAWAIFPAAVTLLPSLSLPSLAVYAAPSISLVILWAYIAGWHRIWAARSYDIVRGIEIFLLGIDQTQPEETIWSIAKAGHKGLKWSGSRPMTCMRGIIVVGTISAWVLLALVSEYGTLTIGRG